MTKERMAKTIMCLLLFPLMTGCWDRTELNDLALITATAFDQEDKDHVKVTIQVIIPANQSGMQSGGGGSTGQRSISRSALGSNAADALSKLQRKMPRRLFWGQCKIFIFGEALAKNGLTDDLDFLLRHPQPRERAYLFVASGQASDDLELFPPIERTSSEALREISNLRVGLRVTMEQFSIMLKSGSGSALLPMTTILSPPKSVDKPFQTIAYMRGAAVFKKGRMAGQLSEEELRGIQLLYNDVQEYTITFKNAGHGDVSLKPVRTQVKLVPRVEGDKWRMEIKVKSEGTIVENDTNLDPMAPSAIKGMNEAYKRDLERRIMLAVRETQKMNVDVLGFADTYERKYPKAWKKAQANWETVFPKVEVTIRVSTSILKPGLIGAPGGLPFDEIKEE